MRGTSNLFLGTLLGDVFGAVFEFSVCSDGECDCVVGFSEKNVPSFDHDSVEEDRVETEIDNRERGLLILLVIFVSDRRRKVAFLA